MTTSEPIAAQTNTYDGTLSIVGRGTAVLSLGGLTGRVMQTPEATYQLTIDGLDAGEVTGFRAAMLQLAVEAGLTGRITVAQKNEITGTSTGFNIDV